jgi:hypothetical protein
LYNGGTAMEKKNLHIGVLGLMPELYQMVPDIQKRLTVWVNEILEKLKSFASVTYSGVCDTRILVENAVAEIERSGAQMLLVFPITYAPSFISVQSLARTRLPIAVSTRRF